LNFPFYIARRYLLAKKSHNAINIISAISMTGMMLGTMALIVVLSVFNGFDNLVKSLINSFNPDIRITLAEGKTFEVMQEQRSALEGTEGVEAACYILEDKALVRYDEQQTIADIMGVSDNYLNVSGIDSMIVEGDFVLQDQVAHRAVIGQGIKVFLNVVLNSPRTMVIYAPRRNAQVSMNPDRDLNRRYIRASGVFAIEQDFDTRYVIVPLSFARELFDYPGEEVSAIELKVSQGSPVAGVMEEAGKVLGEAYLIQNRYQQNELFYKTMQTEKWAIFLILVFILVVASFNVLGTLTMLIIEKKKDIVTLRNLGAGNPLIKRIFLFEGWMISALGAALGTVTGLFICWLQVRFELIKLQGSGSFVVDAYPIHVQAPDVLLSYFVVLAIGFFAAWYPIRYIAKRELL